MKIDLSSDEELALRRLADEVGCSLEDAAKTGLRDWLIGHGYLDLLDVLDEESETQGEA